MLRMQSSQASRGRTSTFGCRGTSGMPQRDSNSTDKPSSAASVSMHVLASDQFFWISSYQWPLNMQMTSQRLATGAGRPLPCASSQIPSVSTKSEWLMKKRGRSGGRNRSGSRVQ